MSEPFDAIGFTVTDEASYHALAEEAHLKGILSKSRRSHGVLHGHCWSLGSGLEVWTVLYESKEGLFYADCRPAFRAHHVFNFFPWEIIEYEEDGEAVARVVTADSDTEMIFELQNLTEIDTNEFRERPLNAAVSGLAYQAHINSKKNTPSLQPLSSRSSRKKFSENDYALRGTILSWRVIRNPKTASDLICINVDLERITLEVLVNRNGLKGELKRGSFLITDVWLQGHILNEKEVQARYEGIDLEIPRGDYWRKFKREN
ncbi:MAG: DUF3881 family protein [Acidobacteria bacterium]|nr:DUF3881 family protein [Acidobacteriota bacterium]